MAPERLLYRIGPAAAPEPSDWPTAVRAALREPIGGPALEHLVCSYGKVVILADDLTRPTPQKQILPPLLDYLNAAGAPDGNITIIIALGTHRYMTEPEIAARFGEEVTSRVRVINHLWQAPETFVDLGATAKGTPVQVNRTAREAGLLIGTGSIVPHCYAGWAGGAKILQPGICSAETTARTHCMAAEDEDLLGIPGRVENPVRREIEEVAALAGLDFILNVVVDANGAPAWVGAGDTVRAHRAGVAAGERTYVRDIPAPADVVVVDAEPTTKDYWQGIKALVHAQRGVKAGGTVIFVGTFPEGIAPTHPEFSQHSLKPYGAILEALTAGRISDHIASATLRLHALIMAHCKVICVSPGMSIADKGKLGFDHAETVEQALEAALTELGQSADVGVIEYGGDVLPKVAGS